MLLDYEMMFMSFCSNTTGVTCGAGAAYTSGPHEFTPVFSGLSDYSFGNFKLFFIHSFKSCIHAEERWWVLGTIVWRKFGRSNLQHVKVWNDKFTIYLPTSGGFQKVFIFSFLFKPCSYEVAENQYLYFKKLLHNYLIW
jgi:hypothetical protein